MLWVYFDASALIKRYSQENGTSAVILRSALALQQALQQETADELMLWASDKRLGRAARSEGLTVFDPEVETMDRLQQYLAMRI